MPEEQLQDLLERIQKDGVDKAEAEANTIVAAAREEAARIVKEAGKKAETMLRDAESQGQSLVQNGERSLQQGARDIILGVGETITGLLQDILVEEVVAAMTGDAFKETVLKTVEAYSKATEAKYGMDVLLSPDEQKEIGDYVLAKLREKMGDGLEIRSDESTVSGFRVSMKKSGLEHDFTPEAIADSLCRIVRPRLAEIVRKTVDQAS